jgi:hypothetical protein
MITSLNTWCHYYDMIINFLAYMSIFIGALYVAVHNRKLPQWHVTPLWYTGLCAFFSAITILVTWTVGADHPLSYTNLGKLADTLLNVAVAAIALIMLVGTVRQDLRESKKRKANLAG